MKVLVVDDSSTMRKIVSNALRQLDANVVIVEAEDGNDGFAKYGAHADLNLVLCDCNMPNCNGLEMLKKIVATGRKTPVIMVTTEAEKTNVIEAIKAGAKNYVSKPFTPDALNSKIKQTLGLK